MSSSMSDLQAELSTKDEAYKASILYLRAENTSPSISQFFSHAQVQKHFFFSYLSREILD